MKLWAEKEFDVLSRMHAAGVPCPKPLFVNGQAVVLSFLGSEGSPAPTLSVRLASLCCALPWHVLLCLCLSVCSFSWFFVDTRCWSCPP